MGDPLITSMNALADWEPDVADNGLPEVLIQWVREQAAALFDLYHQKGEWIGDCDLVRVYWRPDCDCPNFLDGPTAEIAPPQLREALCDGIRGHFPNPYGPLSFNFDLTEKTDTAAQEGAVMLLRSWHAATTDALGEAERLLEKHRALRRQLSTDPGFVERSRKAANRDLTVAPRAVD